MRLVLAIAFAAAALAAPAASATADSPCLPVLCQPGPVTHCFYTPEVRFCI
ncbi:MAG TPA: hypothetical protein VF519_08690 [Mycobacteriales bacterium]|jgi:ABC-type sugar transport system substrate-binding protein